LETIILMDTTNTPHRSDMYDALGEISKHFDLWCKQNNLMYSIIQDTDDMKVMSCPDRTRSDELYDYLTPVAKKNNVNVERITDQPGPISYKFTMIAMTDGYWKARPKTRADYSIFTKKSDAKDVRAKRTIYQKKFEDRVSACLDKIDEFQYKHPTTTYSRKQSPFRSSFAPSKTFGGVIPGHIKEDNYGASNIAGQMVPRMIEKSPSIGIVSADKTTDVHRGNYPGSKKLLPAAGRLNAYDNPKTVPPSATFPQSQPIPTPKTKVVERMIQKEAQESVGFYRQAVDKLNQAGWRVHQADGLIYCPKCSIRLGAELLLDPSTTKSNRYREGGVFVQCQGGDCSSSIDIPRSVQEDKFLRRLDERLTSADETKRSIFTGTVVPWRINQPANPVVPKFPDQENTTVPDDTVAQQKRTETPMTDPEMAQKCTFQPMGFRVGATKPGGGTWPGQGGQDGGSVSNVRVTGLRWNRGPTVTAPASLPQAVPLPSNVPSGAGPIKPDGPIKPAGPIKKRKWWNEGIDENIDRPEDGYDFLQQVTCELGLPAEVRRVVFPQRKFSVVSGPDFRFEYDEIIPTQVGKLTVYKHGKKAGEIDVDLQDQAVLDSVVSKVLKMTE